MNDLGPLGTLEELPSEYVAALRSANLVPLWPSLRALVPPGNAKTNTQPTLWKWTSIRPLLLQAGDLTPMDKAERRVLVLANPGRGLDNLQASSVIYLGMQLVLPGEVAPNHRHTPNAARIVVEGSGACTIVGGEKCPMHHGDLVLTPTGLWHEHRHEGAGPFVWLDVLDIPLMLSLDASYVLGGSPQQDVRPPASYGGGSVVPRIRGERTSARYPQLRYEWSRTRAALDELAKHAPRDRLVEVAYVNPETGGDCLNTIAFSALALRPGEQQRLRRMSPAQVVHVIEGRGEAVVNGNSFGLEVADTFCAPAFAQIDIVNASADKPLYLIAADESPVHRKLGVFEVGEPRCEPL